MLCYSVRVRVASGLSQQCPLPECVTEIESVYVAERERVEIDSPPSYRLVMDTRLTTQAMERSPGSFGCQASQNGSDRSVDPRVKPEENL